MTTVFYHLLLCRQKCCQTPNWISSKQMTVVQSSWVAMCQQPTPAIFYTQRDYKLALTPPGGHSGGQKDISKNLCQLKLYNSN